MITDTVCVETSLAFKIYIVEPILECFKFKPKPGCYGLEVFSINMAGFQTKARKLCKQEINSLGQKLLSAKDNLSYSPWVEESYVVIRIKINHLSA